MDANATIYNQFWGCDNSPPLNKNLVPRFKTWGKKAEGKQSQHNLLDPTALLEDVDSF